MDESEFFVKSIKILLLSEIIKILFDTIWLFW